jgi:hypothetical protein
MPTQVLFEHAKTRLMKHREINPETQCWTWHGQKSLRYGKTHVGREFQIDLHRLSYMLFVGPIPDGKFVLHHCDNPPCWNPDHLWIGTNRENLIDMTNKGRHRNQLKTHCPYGHPLDGCTQRQRYCKTCDRLRRFS